MVLQRRRSASSLRLSQGISDIESFRRDARSICFSRTQLAGEAGVEQITDPIHLNTWRHTSCNALLFGGCVGIIN
jgi:hypothetical protein